MGGAFLIVLIKDIFGIAMGLVLIGRLNVMGNALKGMRHVVLMHANRKTKCIIIKVAMDCVFQFIIMKGATGIAMGNAHQRVYHVMEIASKGMRNVVTAHVYILIK